MRLVLAVVAGAAVAATGAVLLGEYNFSGVPIFGGGVLLGLFVGEAVVSVGARRGFQPGALSLVLAGAGLVWAAWISSGHQLSTLPTQGWFVVVVGALAAGLMALSPWQAAGSRPAPSETD